MSDNLLKIGLIQMAMSTDSEVNTHTAVGLIRDAAAQGATIVCLPELFQSRYFCQSEDTAHFAQAEAVPGPTTELFDSLATELGIVIIASLFEKRAPGLFHNTAAVIDGADGYLGKYRKMHIPDDPLYYEKFYFAPGDLGFRNWNTSKGDLGVLICWDQWYPEAARMTALQGASLLFYPTAIGWHPVEKAEYGKAQQDSWITIQRSHAIANGCFVAAVNRIGFEPTDPANPDAEVAGEGIEFWGSSFVAGPDGAIVLQAPETEQGSFVAEIDLNLIDDARTGWPFLRDRRIDAYGGLSARFLDDVD